MRASILWVLCALTTAMPVMKAADAELHELEASIMAAESQTDMNLRSFEVAQYLDQKLTELESQIMQRLDEEALRLFQEAAGNWRSYRLSQQNFEGAQSRGGSIHALVQNLAFIRITRERIVTLSGLGLGGGDRVERAQPKCANPHNAR